MSLVRIINVNKQKLVPYSFSESEIIQEIASQMNKSNRKTLCKVAVADWSR